MFVNAGARLDRLPISSFHYRIFALVGAGMFFDGYDLYVAGGVLAATIQTKFSTTQRPREDDGGRVTSRARAIEATKMVEPP